LVQGGGFGRRTGKQTREPVEKEGTVLLLQSQDRWERKHLMAMEKSPRKIVERQADGGSYRPSSISTGGKSLDQAFHQRPQKWESGKPSAQRVSHLPEEKRALRSGLLSYPAEEKGGRGSPFLFIGKKKLGNKSDGKTSG